MSQRLPCGPCDSWSRSPDGAAGETHRWSDHGSRGSVALITLSWSTSFGVRADEWDGANFHPVIQSFVLPMLDTQLYVLMSSAVGSEFARDYNLRGYGNLLQEFTHQAFGGCLVASTLDQNIKDEAVLVHSWPEPVLLSNDDNFYFSEMLAITRLRSAAADGVGKLPAEFFSPATNPFMADLNPVDGQHLLNHAEAQRKPEI
jgi:hypothetical protein